MRVLVCNKPYVLEYKEVQFPELERGHAVVRIRSICICGTDLHAYEGTQPFFTYPRILGHELSGELVDFDDAPGFKKGEAVTFLPYINCGYCMACRMGKTNCCVRLQVCGVHVDGGMADYFMIPSRLLVHSKGLSYAELAMVEPFAIGAHAVRRAAVKQDEYVLVSGAGPIGLSILEFARIRQARLIVTDTNQRRLDFCKNQLGIQYALQATASDLAEIIKEITNGDMVDTVFDATGNLKAIQNGLKYMSYGGRYVLVGLQKDDFAFSHPEFHKKESSLLGSRNATREDFDYVIQEMISGSIHPLRMVTNRLPFDHAAAFFPEWLNQNSDQVKVMVEKE